MATLSSKGLRPAGKINLRILFLLLLTVCVIRWRFRPPEGQGSECRSKDCGPPEKKNLRILSFALVNGYGIGLRFRPREGQGVRVQE